MKETTIHFDHIHIVSPDAHATAAWYAEKLNGEIGKEFDVFGFTVDGDFDGYCSQLKEKGVKFTLEPMNFSPTSCIAYLEDLDGIKIELLQRS